MVADKNLDEIGPIPFYSDWVAENRLYCNWVFRPGRRNSADSRCQFATTRVQKVAFNYHILTIERLLT